MRLFFFIIVMLVTSGFCPSVAQDESASVYGFYLQPEWMTGKVVPIYAEAPSADFRQSLSVNIAYQYRQSSRSWVNYYNHPYIGASVTLSKLGAPETYGNEVSIIPYIMFNPLGDIAQNTYLKTGLGGAYFDNPHDIKLNPNNQVIGSHFNWEFQMFLYHEFHFFEHTNIVLGGGYLHASNGHTQLPNLGLNSAILSLSANVNLFQVKQQNKSFDAPAHKRTSFLQLSQGIGMQELGTATGPVGGKKRTIHVTSLAYGQIFNNHLKVRTGLTYRYYQQYEWLIHSENLEKYKEHPARAASSIHFFLGSEFLIGHFSIDVEGGLMLYRPMFKEFYKYLGGNSASAKYFLKRNFISRLGMQYYLFNTEKHPRFNVFVGAHINANLGQADFSSANIGTVYRF